MGMFNLIPSVTRLVASDATFGGFFGQAGNNVESVYINVSLLLVIVLLVLVAALSILSIGVIRKRILGSQAAQQSSADANDEPANYQNSH